jgi:hypothetical protein
MYIATYFALPTHFKRSGNSDAYRQIWLLASLTGLVGAVPHPHRAVSQLRRERKAEIR